MAEYIEREVAIDFVNNYTPNIDGETTIQCVKTALKNAPTADVVPVVRCKDCVYCVDLGTSGLYCDHDDNRNPLGCRPNDYCNDGERRGSNE
jgi:hypothetical protein